MINQDDFTFQSVRFIAIKYLGSGWKEESIETILDLFIFDFKEKQEKVLYKDSEIWMMLNNWAVLFTNLMTKGQNKELPFNSIKDLMEQNLTNDQKDKLEKDDKAFMKNAESLSKMVGIKLAQQKNKK